MKIVRVKVWCATKYASSAVKDVIEVEVDEEATEEEIDKAAEEAYYDWLGNNTDNGFAIITE